MPRARYPFHPILLGIYPALALLSYNIQQITPSITIRAILVTTLSAMGLWLILRLILRNTQKSALAASWLWMLFFSYGQVYTYLEQTPVLGMLLGRHRFLAPAWLLLSLAGVAWLWRTRHSMARLTPILNAIAAVLVCFPIVQIAQSEVGEAYQAFVQAAPLSAEAQSLHTDENQALPDVYYIILDSYTRADIFEKVFAYDNSPFVQELQQMGFYVAQCSQSNYSVTELSLTSSLNMNYLDKLDERFAKNSNGDRLLLHSFLQQSAVRSLLENLGYKTVAFETGFAWSELNTAAVFLKPVNQIGGMNAFEAMLAKTSALSILSDASLQLDKSLTPDFTYPQKLHRDRVVFALNSLADIPEAISGPKFVFAHIVAPHLPYVLGANGEAITTPDSIGGEEEKAAYRDEVIYINRQISAAVKAILQKSSTPPIIIIQGDHGQNAYPKEERLAILNAYYLPNHGSQSLYPAISPVNSFRVIFNQYFGGRFDLLTDASYYSPSLEKSFDYEEVANPCVP